MPCRGRLASLPTSKDNALRESFAQEAVGRGFSFKKIHDYELESLCLEFTRNTPVFEQTIDSLSFELLDSAARFGWYFDGWDCPIVS